MSSGEYETSSEYEYEYESDEYESSGEVSNKKRKELRKSNVNVLAKGRSHSKRRHDVKRHGQPMPPLRPQVARNRKGICVNMTMSKYPIVRRVTKALGWKDVDDDDFNLWWGDHCIPLEKLISIKPYQRVNHFPGMNEITRKDNLARNLNRMAKQFPDEFEFFPRTWVLPAEHSEFMNFHHANTKKKVTYICKPAASAQGKGIFLTRDPSDIDPGHAYVVQHYLANPFLLEGYKFDLRLYCMVVSCDPLRIMLYREGLVRICSEPYAAPTSKNLGNAFQHLTNYAINKKNEEFSTKEEAGDGTKMLFSQLIPLLGTDEAKLFSEIGDALVKTLLVAQPILAHHYHSFFGSSNEHPFQCFEILGFDVMLDNKLKPWVIEVNHSPSFTCDADVDRTVKLALITDVYKILGLSKKDKSNYLEKQRREAQDRLSGTKSNKKTAEVGEQQVVAAATAKQAAREEKNPGNFMRIYPTENVARQAMYEQMTVPLESLFRQNAATKLRQEKMHATKLKSEAEAERVRKIKARFRPSAQDQEDETPEERLQRGRQQRERARKMANMREAKSKAMEMAEYDLEFEDDIREWLEENPGDTIDARVERMRKQDMRQVACVVHKTGLRDVVLQSFAAIPALHVNIPDLGEESSKDLNVSFDTRSRLPETSTFVPIVPEPCFYDGPIVPARPNSRLSPIPPAPTRNIQSKQAEIAAQRTQRAPLRSISAKNPTGWQKEHTRRRTIHDMRPPQELRATHDGNSRTQAGNGRGATLFGGLCIDGVGVERRR